MIVNFKDVNLDEPNLVGGKGASLANMIINLSDSGIDIPDGFILTTKCYQSFMNHNHLYKKIYDLLDQLDVEDLHQLKETGEKIRSLFDECSFPEDVVDNIFSFYQKLSQKYHCHDVDVGVRSSAVGEDGTDHSWAGQLDTFLNIKGESALLLAIKQCFASMYTDRLISYRAKINENNDVSNHSMAVVVQKMVRSDLGSSGVAFSIDTESGFSDVVVINGSYGLGELIVQGSVKPDEYIVHKPLFEKGFKSIIDKKIGSKDIKMVYDKSGTKVVDVSKSEMNRFCLSDEQIMLLTRWVLDIEEYYQKPVDVEWALEEINEESNLYIVQARPETVHSKTDKSVVKEYSIQKNNETPLVVGIAVGSKIASGRVKIVESLESENAINFQNGDILVVDQTSPDWEPLMIKSSAIICNRGGRTCHAAIIARECGIVAVVGCSNATQVLNNDDLVTVSCAEGEEGYVYPGEISFTEKCFDLNELPDVKTNIMLNVANPNEVFNFANYPAKGVGLVREEFIINNYIQVHPNALINYHQLTDQVLIDKIDQLMVGYSSPTDFYVNKLVYGLARIAATFYPHDVIVRFSDFKSNEYGSLLGGSYYESLNEQNPMIGYRGASRYYDDSFKDAFGLECRAIKKLRDVLGLTNVIVMIPFCRTPKECKKVLRTMKKYGLKRGENGLQVYIMCEVPSNVILAKDFCKLVDGFSIGSNDLTQLTLGLDRDSELVSHLYDEKNKAVKQMIKKAIRTCKKYHTKIGICGQGPSDYPEFAQFLVEQGIDSISVTPDALFKTVQVVHQVESLCG